MGKNVFFEASVRVPLMISYPSRIRPGRYDALVETIDLLPTLFELLGLAAPYECHGRSLVPLFTGGRGNEARDAAFSENVIPEVITSGSLDFDFEKGKGIKGIRHPDAKMVRTRRWKYNYYPEGFAELYDLEEDPHELHNLAGDPNRRAVESELKGRILDWLINATETDQIAPRWRIS
jgi:arylsulfatase A-like enzyme